MIKKFVYVTLQKEFIHKYEDAPDEVFYLRYPHRHLLHIKVSVEVFDNDREIEFIMLKHYLELSISFKDAVGTSCETIAEQIIQLIKDKYGSHRDIKVVVSEDGENGCELSYIGGTYVQSLERS